jgi:hypothetical protein
MTNQTCIEPAVDELIQSNIQLRYTIEKLEKKLEVFRTIAKELLECSVASSDPLEETRYSCASCFLETELKNI